MTTSIHDTRHAAELAQRGAALFVAAVELSPSARGEALELGAAFFRDAVRWSMTGCRHGVHPWLRVMWPVGEVAT